MERFLSNAVNRIDVKGRVSVPAQFRSTLQIKGLTDLYALQSIDMAAIDAGGMDLLEKYEERMALDDPFLRSSDDMSFFCHGDGAFLKLDGAGRITVTDFMREHTGITDHIAFVGRGHFFQMWEPTRFADYRSQVRARLLAKRDQNEGQKI
ncbi:MAG: division/cell wall cluster transcriptional repressor MraZ [Ahrensia sp.]|nr:division/cell wall cluster transcriptional repressor MraZ [Ahrensia sp.]